MKGSRICLAHVCVCLLVLTLSLVATPAAGAAGSVSSTGENAPLSTLPLTAQSGVSAAVGRSIPAYFVRPVIGGLDASNPGQDFETRFRVEAVDVCSGRAHWQLSLRGYGYFGAIETAPSVAPHGSFNRVEYRRGPLTEWYENGPVGLEQGFTFAERPGPVNGQPLTVVLSAAGDVSLAVDKDGTSLTLTGHDRKTALRYAGLRALDASGKRLRAWLEVRGKQMLLKVNDTAARYPVVIDPWLQRAKLTAAHGMSNDQLGWSVAVSGDTVVVGAPFAAVGSNSEQGTVYVFVKPAGGWANMTQTAKLTAADGHSGDMLGTSVSINRNVVFAGAPFAAAVYVFVKPQNGWRTTSKFKAKLTTTSEGTGDYFGESVSASEDAAVVGAPRLATSGPGSAYVYVKPAGGWKSMSETAKLTASDGVVGDQGGNSVGISGNTVVFGAPNHSPRGAAYVFVKPASGWKTTTQTAELTMAERIASSAFGYSVSISGNTVVSGAWAVKFRQETVGAAFLFVEPAGGWKNMTETAKLTIPRTPFTFDFGYSVAINGNSVVIGAPAYPYGSGLGSAYVFLKPASGWKTTSKFNAKLLPSDSALDDRFGFSVAASGRTAVVGATIAGGSNSSPGAGFVFEP